MLASINLKPSTTAILASSILSMGPVLGASEIAIAADRAGVASAVTPSATSKPPSAATGTLKIGKSMF